MWRQVTIWTNAVFFVNGEQIAVNFSGNWNIFNQENEFENVWECRPLCLDLGDV